MSRFLYLVCYDVADPKKLRRIRKMTAAYAVGGQKSLDDGVGIEATHSANRKRN